MALRHSTDEVLRPRKASGLLKVSQLGSSCTDSKHGQSDSRVHSPNHDSKLSLKVKVSMTPQSSYSQALSQACVWCLSLCGNDPSSASLGKTVFISSKQKLDTAIR